MWLAGQEARLARGAHALQIRLAPGLFFADLLRLGEGLSSPHANDQIQYLLHEVPSPGGLIAPALRCGCDQSWERRERGREAHGPSLALGRRPAPRAANLTGEVRDSDMGKLPPMQVRTGSDQKFAAASRRRVVRSQRLRLVKWVLFLVVLGVFYHYAGRDLALRLWHNLRRGGEEWEAGTERTMRHIQERESIEGQQR